METLGFRMNPTKKSNAANEIFKSLRTNIMYSDDAQIIAVTSTIPGEGKTTVAYNLAESFAMMDRRVLLIDADLRKGSMNRFFVHKQKVSGLSELLSGQEGHVICATPNINLDVILGGMIPPNPSELLSNDLFVQILDKLRNSYDHIIIDTPPMKISSDASIVGCLADATLLVVRNDFVKRKDVKRTKDQLERNGARLLGVVLNGVKKNQVDYDSYSYDYYEQK